MHDMALSTIRATPRGTTRALKARMETMLVVDTLGAEPPARTAIELALTSIVDLGLGDSAHLAPANEQA